jgi:hypothetical protein
VSDPRCVRDLPGDLPGDGREGERLSTAKTDAARDLAFAKQRGGGPELQFNLLAQWAFRHADALVAEHEKDAELLRAAKDLCLAFLSHGHQECDECWPLPKLVETLAQAVEKLDAEPRAQWWMSPADKAAMEGKETE